MQDQKVIDLIQAGNHQKAFEKLYRFFPGVRKYICSNSGSVDEALDIFQDALVILNKKIIQQEIPSKFSCEGYLFNTAKLLWSNELRKKKVRRTDDNGFDRLTNEDGLTELFEKEKKLKIVENVFLKLGEKCRNILELFYFKKLSMEVIATKAGFKTVDSAKVQKYKCIETARQFAMQEWQKNQN